MGIAARMASVSSASTAARDHWYDDASVAGIRPVRRVPGRWLREPG
ncbi:hypothetical protein SCANM63S_03604 [Streptomyces canarius]